MEQRSEPTSAPGWYPDPTRRSEFRYFNGERWTADVSIDGQRFVDQLERPSVQAKSRTLAVLTLVFGLGGLLIAWLPFLFVVGAMAAVTAGILGILALRAIRRDVAFGRGLAIAGMIAAAAALCLCAVGFVLTRSVVREFVEYVDPGPVDVVVTDCTADGLQVSIEGTLDNRDDRTHDYVIVIEVADGVGERASSYVHVDDVVPGEHRTWTYRQLIRGLSEDNVRCDVLGVNGPFPFGLEEDASFTT